MTGVEIAEWLGISYNNTYRKNPKKYIARLEEYCIFEIIRGGVIIKEIFIKVYDKNLNQKMDSLYLEKLCEHNNLMTMQGLSEETNISPYHCTKSRDRMFGDKPINKDPEAKGLLGYRESIWAIKMGRNTYRKLTEEENQLFNNLIKSYCANVPEEKIKARQLILEYCREADMSVNEYMLIVENADLDFFGSIIENFRNVTGYMVAPVTEHMINFEQPKGLSEDQKVYREKLMNEIIRLNAKNRVDS